MSDSIAVPHRGDGAPQPAGAPAIPVRSSDKTARLLGLAVGSIGVVYGDIGTSPLYALREAVNAAVGPHGSATSGAVLGVLSLILWALIFIVTFKYVIVLLRADNNGEGGTLTLMALARQATGDHAPAVVMLGIIGAALFFGDALITPGDLGAVRDRRHQDRGARLRSLHRAADRRDPGRPVRRAGTGHRERRQSLRPDHDGVVPRHRDPGRDLDRQGTRSCWWRSIRPMGCRSCSPTG